MEFNLGKIRSVQTLRSKYPSLYVAIGFLAFIFAGAFLLILPISAVESVSFIDALFVSTSAVCVTGLSPVVLATTFTPFGKVVIALLIQLGGLGFVTTAMLVFTLLGIKLGINDKYLLQETLAQDTHISVSRFLKKVILITAVVEGYGFLVNLIFFAQDFPFWTAVGISMFHAISTFNNAGLDIIGAESLIGYADNAILLIHTSILSCLGGLGFFVIDDVLTQRRWRRLSMHSKIVLVMTLALAVCGTLLVKFSRWDFSWLDAYFTNMMTRSCGLTSVSLSDCAAGTVLILVVLMLIGSSPCGTGGGLKTTTAFVVGLGIKSYVVGRPPVAFYRRISQTNLLRAFLLTVLSLIFITAMSFFVSLAEPGVSLEAILMEVTSAFGTVGLSMGITSALGIVSKLLLCVVMLVGRLGPLTVLTLLNRSGNRQESSSISYVEGNIMIG